MRPKEPKELRALSDEELIDQLIRIASVASGTLLRKLKKEVLRRLEERKRVEAIGQTLRARSPRQSMLPPRPRQTRR